MKPNNDHAGSEPARLEVEHISVAYDGVPILQDVSFEVAQGARVAVVGPNGAGKSTLFKALVGLLPPQRGRILIHHRTLEKRQDCIAYVPQREEVDWRFPVTVEDVVLMGRYGRLGRFQRPGKSDEEIVRRSLDQMSIRDLIHSPIGDLSGGQQQRVFLARALAQEPHILLLDEPFNGIDLSTQEATLQLLDRLRDAQVTVLISTHDLNLAMERFDRVLLLNRRLVAYGPPREVFSHDHLHEAFSGQVLLLNGALVVDQCCGAEEISPRRLA
ncbi:MAG TPA: metal ABC transporter ATP-binding protein [Anaerolineaceae bacterium]|jgi:ABC-type Mn2+/Zn2+ transport system ATPase subunit